MVGERMCGRGVGKTITLVLCNINEEKVIVKGNANDTICVIRDEDWGLIHALRFIGSGC
jgi:hypothetical protein